MNYKDFKNELELYLRYNRSIVYISNCDLESIIDDIIDALRYHYDEKKISKIKEWNPGKHTVKFGKDTRVIGEEDDSLSDFITKCIDNKERSYYVIRGFHQIVNAKTEEASSVVSLLQDFSNRNSIKRSPDERSTIIIISSEREELPNELKRYVSQLEVPYPDKEDIEEEIKPKIKGGKGDYDYSNLFMKYYEINIGSLVFSLQGMSMYNIRKLMYYTSRGNREGKINPRDIRNFQREKERIVRDSGILEVCDTNGISVDSVGGLELLKQYLKDKKEYLDIISLGTKEYKTVPRGILLVGVPGCGKSLVAKTASAIFDFPLLKLDIGRLMGKYVGESEHNLNTAIKIAEAAAPCVLWVDEIEKAFAGVTSGGGGSEVTVRLMGLFLTWMQERMENIKDKTNLVYIIATANNVDEDKLPPEFLRKGRFDEIFRLLYPTKTEAKDILQKLARKYDILLPNSGIVDEMATKLSDNKFSGAEIRDILEQLYEKNVLNKSNDRPTVDVFSFVNEYMEDLTRRDSVTVADSNRKTEKQKRIEKEDKIKSNGNYKPASKE